MPTAVPVVQLAAGELGTASNNVVMNSLAGFQLKFKDAAKSRHRFTAMWYLDDTTKPPRPAAARMFTTCTRTTL